MNNTPKIVSMEVYPVAGADCMELNLSGAHAPYFTRNVVVLTDSTGNTGIDTHWIWQEGIEHLTQASLPGQISQKMQRFELTVQNAAFLLGMR